MGGSATHVAWTPSIECHYPPDKCNAPGPQFLSGVCVSSTDSGTDTDYTFLVWGPKLAHTSDSTSGAPLGRKNQAIFSSLPLGYRLLTSRQPFFDAKFHKKRKTKKICYFGPS